MTDPYIPIAHHWYGFYIVGAWILLLLLVGRISDWAKLARQFPADSSRLDEAVWHGWQSGRINAVPYVGCLWVAFGSEGMLLKTGPDIFLRAGHPPLFIPWRDIQTTETRRGLWGAQRVLILSESGGKLCIALPEKLLQKAEAWLPA